MKSFIFASALLFSLASFANQPVFTLDCRWDTGGNGPVGGPRYQVLKVAKKVKGKWANEYKLKSIPRNPTAKATEYKLESAGSGDEDYNDYNVVDRSNRTYISGVTIQNRFEWATLSDSEGYVSYRCEKAETAD